MKRMPTLPGGNDQPPPRWDQLGALAVLATALLGTLALTGDVQSAVTAVTVLRGLVW